MIHQREGVPSPSRSAWFASTSAVQQMIGASGLIAESPVSIPTFSAPKISTRSKNFSLTSAFSGAVYTDRWPRASATAWAATAIIDLPEPVGVEAMTWESVTISHSASSWCGYSSKPRLSDHAVNESMRSSSDGWEFGAGKAVIALQSALLPGSLDDRYPMPVKGSASTRAEDPITRVGMCVWQVSNLSCVSTYDREHQVIRYRTAHRVDYLRVSTAPSGAITVLLPSCSTPD